MRFLLSSILLLQYFLELMKVPGVESKLRVFSFKIQFGTKVRWYYLLCYFLFFGGKDFGFYHCPSNCLFLVLLLMMITLQITELNKGLNVVNSACKEVRYLQ